MCFLFLVKGLLVKSSERPEKRWGPGGGRRAPPLDEAFVSEMSLVHVYSRSQQSLADSTQPFVLFVFLCVPCKFSKGYVRFCKGLSLTQFFLVGPFGK